MNRPLGRDVGFAIGLTCLLLIFGNQVAAQDDMVERMIQAGVLPVDYANSSGSVKIRLEALARLEIAGIIASCSLKPEQVEKLQLAASADISRYMHDMAQVQEIALGRNQGIALDERQQRTIVLMQRDQKADSGVFGKGSLLDKTLSSTLSQSQKESLQTMQAERIKQRHHARVLQTVAAIERRLLLRDAQRNWLVERMDRQELDAYPPHLEAHVGQLKLLKIPQAEMQTMFDDQELDTISSLFERFRGLRP